MTVEIVLPRETTLGGPAGARVRRTLPTRKRSLIGGWCFVDHYGPDEIGQGGGMRVAPHPHTGLQTLSWLFAGEVEHRDSAGHHALIRPGEVNLMTAGRGISHSEMSTSSAAVLHGVQLWVALPASARATAPGFAHHVPEELRERGLSARVLVGSLLGSSSPVISHSPLMGAELSLAPGASIDLPVDGSFEHGVLVDSGDLLIDGHAVPTSALAYLPSGSRSIRLSAATPTRLLLLGGEPLGEAIVMWWNFIGRSHEEIAEFREQWLRETEGTADSTVFGMPIDDEQPPLAAPGLPGLRLKPRT